MGKLLLQDSKEDSSVHKDGILKANKLFEVGMRLEAGDRLSPWVVRPARIEDVLPLEGVYCMCVYLLCIQATYIYMVLLHMYGISNTMWRVFLQTLRVTSFMVKKLAVILTSMSKYFIVFSPM